MKAGLLNKSHRSQQFAVGGCSPLLALAAVTIGVGCHPDKKVTVWDKEVVLRIVEAPDTCAVGETISLTVSFENTTTETLMLRLSDNLWLFLPPSDDPNIICAEPLFAMNSDSVFDIHLKGGETCTQDVEFVPFDDVMPGSYPYIAAYGMILDREGEHDSYCGRIRAADSCGDEGIEKGTRQPRVARSFRVGNQRVGPNPHSGSDFFVLAIAREKSRNPQGGADLQCYLTCYLCRRSNVLPMSPVFELRYSVPHPPGRTGQVDSVHCRLEPTPRGWATRPTPDWSRERRRDLRFSINRSGSVSRYSPPGTGGLQLI